MGYLRSEQLLHIFLLQLDLDYECGFLTAFLALQGHPGFEIQGYTYVPSLKSNKKTVSFICTSYDSNFSFINC